MSRFQSRVRILSAVAGAAVALTAGCTTVGVSTAPGRDDRVEAVTLKETGTLLRMVRGIGWRELQDLQPLLAEQRASDFPGVAAVAAGLHAIAVTCPSGAVPPAWAFEALVNGDPNFWRAYYEIVPGDPLVAMLHVSLLLASGDAVRADRIAVLSISFGKMDLSYRKELVRLDTYAQLVIHVSGGDGAMLARLRAGKAYRSLEAKALAALEVWPRNPRALADLAWCRQNRSAPGVAAAWAALWRADPLFKPPGPALEPAALTAVRRIWESISDDRAAGDDRVLERFSVGAQAAGLDELALASRSLLAGWRDGTLPVDSEFVRASLRRLVGTEQADDICREVFRDDREWLGLSDDSEGGFSSLKGVPVHPQLEQRLLMEIAEASYWIESGLSKGRTLAGNYGERGAAWAELWQLKDAEADLRRSLALDPSNNKVRYGLAVALSDAGQIKEADAVFAEAARRGPVGASETQAWANHLFIQGRFADAEAAYARASRLDPKIAYSRMMADLARLRQGKRRDVRVSRTLMRADPWGASLLEFVAGRLDEKAVFARLEPQGGLRHSEQECELYFVLAEMALGRGDVFEARRNLGSCLGTGITSFVEYAMAWHELRRLDSSQPPPKDDKSGGDDLTAAEPA